MHNNQNMLINDILFIITLIWMHVNTEKGKNKKEVNMFFCSLSVNNSMYVNSQSKNIHNKFLWLNREANHQAHKRAPRLPIHAMTSDLYTYTIIHKPTIGLWISTVGLADTCLNRNLIFHQTHPLITLSSAWRCSFLPSLTFITFCCIRFQ